MKINNIPVAETIAQAKKLLSEETTISPALKSVFTLVLVLLDVMMQQLGLNLCNSGKPSATDTPDKKKKEKKKSTTCKPGS